MIEFLLGPCGSGKTVTVNKMITNDLKSGKKVILIVPEQMAIRAESAICEEAQLQSIPQTDLEILNFKRLCNRIFREYGGIAYNTVSSGAKALLMWEALFSAAPHLKQYGSEIEDAQNFIPTLLSSVEELKAYNITPDQLEKTAQLCADKNKKLSEKLSDLAIISSAYKMCLDRGFDDPSDDLTKLSLLLKQNKFFENKQVYLDSFLGFTPQELAVISLIMHQAENTVVTLTYTENDNSYEPIKETYKQLRNAASSANSDVKVTRLEERFRFKTEEMNFLAENLWNFGSDRVFEQETKNIRTVSAENIYDEVEFIGYDIMSKIQSGARYRDIAVITGNTELYDGILDAAFERYGIPCHFSKKIQLSEKPIFKLILSSLRVRSCGWKTDDVIAMLKTGLMPVTPMECDLLEAYASSWDIIGRTWYDDNDWMMNPDGYSEKLSEESKELLKNLNEIRKRFTAPLTEFFECLDGKSTVKTICTSIYKMLSELMIPDTLSKTGNDDDIRVWNCLCDALDTLVTVCPERKADDKLFAGLLTLVINQSNFGALPALCDEVVFGSAGLIRTSGIKHTYLIGVNEGIFPAAKSEVGLFSDGEKDILEEYDLILSPKSDDGSMRELFNFYAAACSPCETLTVTRYESDIDGKKIKPSIAFDRINAVFPNSEKLNTSLIPVDCKIRNKKMSLELASSVNTNEGKALRKIFSSDAEYAGYFEKDRQPLVSSNIMLSDDSKKNLYGSSIGLTQSRLEAYVNCPFDHFCQYQLKLKEKRSSQFNAADIGTLIHHILECFFRKVSDEKRNVSEISEEETDVLVSDILDDYLKTIFGTDNGGMLTPRAMQLFLRLKRAVKCVIKNLLEELSQSEFTPAFFEMPINTSGDEGTVAPLKIPLASGCNVFIYGVADRVDICRNGDDVLVRVVDYKTGKKDFSLTDIAAGLNLQMLLYLFSIWHDEGGTFRKAVNCTGSIIPTGVLYTPASPKSSVKKVSSDSTPEEIYRAISKNLSRKGLLINDEEILRKMEKMLSETFIPVKIKDNVPIPSNKNMTLMSLSELGKLESQISETVAALTEEMRGGDFSARPRLNDKDKPEKCRYCPHKPICRSALALENDVDDDTDNDEEYDEEDD